MKRHVTTGPTCYRRGMADPDLNLLLALDVLLSECSVARAAKRLRLSPSATSRTLARLRDTTGDPLLVRAGRGLTPTPRALELHARLAPLIAEARAVLSPPDALDPGALRRSFTLRTTDGFIETFAPALLARVRAEAPGVTLRFIAKTDPDSAPLREGEVDLETGVVGPSLAPELRAQGLFRDRFIGVTRPGHALSEGPITAERYASADHVSMWRPGVARGPVDEALAPLGLSRTIVTMVSGFSAALALARRTDLVASVPARITAGLREDLREFALPFEAPQVTVSLLWHPRMDADAAHRWLRTLLRAVCAEPSAADAPPARSAD